jgi:hypothetical protein
MRYDNKTEKRYSEMKHAKPWNPLNALFGKPLNKKIKQLNTQIPSKNSNENSDTLQWEDLLGRK